MGLYYFDYSYFLFMLPALLITMYAQFQVNSTFQKYSRVNTYRNMTGADAAMRVMQYGGAQGRRNFLFHLLRASSSGHSGRIFSCYYSIPRPSW